MDILVAIGFGILLSIDCFFVVMLYTYCNKNKNMTIIPILIGAFHILFPLAAYGIASLVKGQIGAQSWIPAVAFIYLGLTQIFGKEDEDEVETCSTRRLLVNTIILCVSVSIDSIFMGMSLAFTTRNIFLYAPIFGLVAFTISGTAVYAGKKLGNKFSVDLSKVCGLVFIVLAFLFYFEVL